MAMPFQESAESFKAKAHISNVKTPVLVGIAALALVVLFLVFQSVWGLVRGDGFAIYQQDAQSQGGSGEDGGQPVAAAAVEKPTIFVHMGGAVVNPGVYELEDGSRVLAGVEAAGGLTADAAPDTVNLARKLVDGEQVIILTKEEAAAYEAGGQQGTAASKGKVSINSAGINELVTLPGIGEATARKIVADREANGPFQTLEDLMRVSGIGEKKFADLLPYITL